MDTAWSICDLGLSVYLLPSQAFTKTCSAPVTNRKLMAQVYICSTTLCHRRSKPVVPSVCRQLPQHRQPHIEPPCTDNSLNIRRSSSTCSRANISETSLACNNSYTCVCAPISHRQPHTEPNHPCCCCCCCCCCCWPYLKAAAVTELQL